MFLTASIRTRNELRYYKQRGKMPRLPGPGYNALLLNALNPSATHFCLG